VHRADERGGDERRDEHATSTPVVHASRPGVRYAARTVIVRLPHLEAHAVRLPGVDHLRERAAAAGTRGPARKNALSWSRTIRPSRTAGTVVRPANSSPAAPRSPSPHRR
jgi:hypothetical protein